MPTNHVNACLWLIVDGFKNDQISMAIFEHVYLIDWKIKIIWKA